MAVTVSSSIMKRILQEAGFPIVEYSDVGLTETEAAELFVWPAMQMYFSYYPKSIKTSHQVSGEVSIDFPNEFVFDISHARVSLSSSSDANLKYNPLHNTSFRYSNSYGTIPGRRGSPYVTQELRLLEQTNAVSMITLRKAGSFDVDYENRKLVGFSNVSGELIIKWAMFSENFDAIKFVHTEDVVKMARAQALRFFGMFRNQQDPNSGVALNGDQFIQRADAIEEKILEKWQGASKIVVLH